MASSELLRGLLKAELIDRIAALELEIDDHQSTRKRAIAERDRARVKVSNMRREIISMKADRDRLAGYIDRVHRQENPPGEGDLIDTRSFANHSADGIGGAMIGADGNFEWWE